MSSNCVFLLDGHKGNRLEVFVEDDEALQRWGRKGKHIVGVYEPQSDRSNMTESELTQYTRTELNKRIKSIVSYEAGITDLENVPGLENKKIRFADTIRIKDLKFNPPLYLEARIFNQKRDVFTKADKRVELGDFIEYTQEEVQAIWKTLQQQIRNKISLAQMREYAEPKKVLSDTPPTDQTENVTWIDTSQDPYVPKVYNFGEWEKLSPTTANEVDAYTKVETDDIAKDASGLETGIIDVGAVPLRTSVTGARIEWDGINGLVQYNTDGDPVNWFDLDGSIYVNNGYFSGDIEASMITGSGFIYEEGSAKVEIGVKGPWISSRIGTDLDFDETRIYGGNINLSVNDESGLDLAPGSIRARNAPLEIAAFDDINSVPLPVNIESPLKANSLELGGNITARLLYYPQASIPYLTSLSSGTTRIDASDGGYVELGQRGGTSQIRIHRDLYSLVEGDFYLRPRGSNDVRVANANGQFRPVWASAFNESSSREFKTNVEDYTESALDVINDLSVVTYNLKDDLENGIEDTKIGFISEDSPAIATLDLKAIQSYKLSAYNTKAIQELAKKVEDMELLIK